MQPKRVSGLIEVSDREFPSSIWFQETHLCAKLFWNSYFMSECSQNTATPSNELVQKSVLSLQNLPFQRNLKNAHLQKSPNAYNIININ